MMHALVLLCIKQHTKFEVHSFTSQIYDEAKFLKTRHVTLTMPCPLWGSMLSQSYLVYSTCLQNLATLTSAVTKI